MGRRTVLLIAAVVVAALGTGLIFAYVSGVNNRALADQSPQRVLVAKVVIPSGTTAADAAKAGGFELKTVAKDSVATGALSDIEPVADQVTLTTIYPGQQIVAAAFGAQGSSSALPIPGSDLAMSVQLDDPARVAGFVEPGSNVAVFATLNPQTGNSNDQQTRLLLPKATVIAVGPTTTTAQTSTNVRTGQSNTEQISKAILTLALSQQDAQKVIYAQQQGRLYFALLTSNSKVAPGPGTDTRNLFS